MPDRKQHDAAGSSSVHEGPAGKTAHKPARRRKFHFRWRALLIVFVIVILLGVLARVLLPWFIRDYVNRTLDRNPLYAGRIGEVTVHLWRGAYAINDVSISKTTGDVPVPLFAAKRVDFAIEWNALWHRKVVGRVLMFQPELNFVDAEEEGDTQTGGEGLPPSAVGGPWLEMIRDLFPFRINSALIRDGSIHFRAFQGSSPFDVYLSHLEASVENLTNIRDDTKPLVAAVRATGLVMDQARFDYAMTFDPFSYRPTFHMGTRLLGLDVTRINDLAKAYGKFDFERGWFDLVVEADAREGQVKGYAKPLFRNLKVFSLTEDIKDENILEVFWQALVGAATSLFKNQSRDQFGTLIPFSGDLSKSTTTDLLATIGNVLRNAFVRAYLPRLEGARDTSDLLQFEPPQISDPVTAGETL